MMRLGVVLLVVAATTAVSGQWTAPDISRGLFAATPVVNAPFSADAKTTITETRKDGTVVEHTITARYYRDSDGRVRVESDIVGAKAGQPSSFVVIQAKPGDNRVYALSPFQKSVIRLPRDVLEGTYDSAATFAIPVGVWEYRGHIAFSRVDPLVEDVESIGERHIDGLPAVGRRMWRFDDVGKEVTTEWWESPDLKVMLSARLSDPRIGSVLEFRLTNIRRREPTASLFVVPEDYTVKSGASPDASARWQHWQPRERRQAK
jgi:hypothetical protein